MAKSDLLKQAIADAKTVKETALANAKIALQEAFAPQIQRMFAEKLDAELMDEEDEAAAMDAGATAGVEAGAGEEVESDDDFNWTDDTLAASVGGKDYTFQIGMGGEEEMPAEEMPVSDEEAAGEYNEGEDLDINEILRELEGETDEMAMEGDEMYGEEDDDTMPMATEGYGKLRSSGIGKKSRKLHEEDEDEMTMEGDEMSDEALEEIIEAILREEEGTEDKAINPNTMSEEEKDEVMEAMEDELEAKEDELKEAYRTVKHLRSVINEVNLLNAKLLYTNKLFRNFELSESQKMKVIENFDRAANTREAKLVFATLAESFKRPTKKRVVKESYASRPTMTTAPRIETTQVLSEGFELANRWKKLAGLL